MQITRLSAAECEDLYRSALPRDFPAAELKPFAEIQRLLESGVYEPLLLTDDAGARLAYAWQVVLPGQRTALLDYFAVRYDLRGSGVGTAALGLVRDYDAMRVHDLVLECESCHGKRFKNDTLEVKFEGKNIYDILEMTVNQAIEFFTEHNQKKIVKKLRPLQDVGLGYIKLGQSSSTLSGGENQRVKLAYFLSIEKAQPTIFVFDEPTTGLHFHDIKKLLEAFDALISRGHTLVIIEHNMDVIKCADHVIDLGPEGGDMGGNLVAAGTPEEVAKCAASYTGQYLAEKLN